MFRANLILLALFLLSCGVVKTDDHLLSSDLLLRIESKSGNAFMDVFRVDIKPETVSYFSGKPSYDSSRGYSDNFELVGTANVNLGSASRAIEILLDKDASTLFPSISAETGTSYYSDPIRELSFYFYNDTAIEKRVTFNQTYPEMEDLLDELVQVFPNQGLEQWLQ